MSDVLEELIAAGKRSRAGDVGFVRSHYIEHPHRVQCLVALDDGGRIVGFQSLKLAHEGNSYGTPVGWGIIGTHVMTTAAGKGFGSRLFRETLKKAREANLPAIEAYIGNENAVGLAYYEALGFRAYRHSDGITCKSFQVSRRPAA